MSTRSSIVYSDGFGHSFHLYDELTDDTIHIEITSAGRLAFHSQTNIEVSKDTLILIAKACKERGWIE